MPQLLDSLVLGAYFTTLVLLSLYGSHRYFLVYLYRKHSADVPTPDVEFSDAELPVVTVQVPLFNERYVCERLINAVCELDYPREKLEVQVLDDSTDDTTVLAASVVERWREAGVDIVLMHRENREGFKAGALHEGLLQAKGDFVAVFDADFVPSPDFLRSTVHFFSSPRVGMVQARWDHLNRHYNLLTQAQAILLDGHFVIEHTARNRSGRFFNFNGTAGIWRIETIREAGGWQHDTLTEDLDLSYRAQLLGWDFVFLKDCPVPSELPVEMSAFKTQQHRWAKGSIQTAKKLLPTILTSSQPLRVKLEAFYHLTANFAYVMLLVLALLMPLATVVRMDLELYWSLMIDLPIFIGATLSICVFYWTSQRELGYGHRQILRQLPVVLAIGIGISLNNAKATIEAVLGHRTPFVRTPKYALVERGDAWMKKFYIRRTNLLPFFELALAVWFTGAIAVVLMQDHPSFYSLPFLLLFQFGFLYVACLGLYQSFRITIHSSSRTQ